MYKPKKENLAMEWRYCKLERDLEKCVEFVAKRNDDDDDNNNNNNNMESYLIWIPRKYFVRHLV